MISFCSFSQIIWSFFFFEKVSIWGVVFTLYSVFLLTFLHLGENQLIFSFLCFFIFSTACFVVDCGGGLAYDVINTIGQAFEIRFKMFLQNPPLATEVPERWGDIYENALLNICGHWKMTDLFPFFVLFSEWKSELDVSLIFSWEL